MEKVSKISLMDQTKAIKHWRSKLEEVIENETFLSKFEVNKEDDQTIMCIKMEQRIPEGKYMTEEDLKFVCKAMATDLSPLFLWNKSDVPAHSTGTLCPYETEDFNKDMWEIISKTICFVGKPVSITDEFGVIRIALGSDSLYELHKEISSSTNFRKYGYSTTIACDKLILNKLSFIAYNFHKLHLLFSN